MAAYFPNTVGQNEAKIQLHLVGSVGGDLNFPQIETDFTVGWKFGGSSATVNSTSFGSAPEVWFKNVEIDPGQAIQSFAKPILERVNAVLAPVRPVIEVLQTPLPIISQLAGRPFTLLDMAESFGPIFGGQLGPTTRQFIKAASDLSNLVNFVQQVSASGNISLGSYRLDQSQEAGNTTSTFDLRSKPISTIDLDKIRDSVTNIKPIEYSLDSKIGGPAKDFLLQARRVPSSNGSENGFSFPILKNPMGILQILTGQSNATLFEYDMPQLLVDAPFQIPLPILPPFLVGFFGGNIGAQMDFNFGFDTTGFKNGRPLDGFYVQDTVGGVAGAPDLMEASLFGSVEIGAKVGISLGPVELVAGAAGGLYAEVGLNLNDPNRDGRVYLPELIENIGRGPEWVFDLQGSFGAFLRAFIKIELSLGFFSITIVDASFELARIVLLDYSAPPRGEIANDDLAEVVGSDLRLNLRPNQDDNFRIRQDADNRITITGRGRLRHFLLRVSNR